MPGSRIQEELELLGIGAISLPFMYNLNGVHIIFLSGLVWAVHSMVARGRLDCLHVAADSKKDSSSRQRGGCAAICEVFSAMFPI